MGSRLSDWRHEVFFDLLKSFSLFCSPSEFLLMFEPNPARLDIK
jgi:hypothetical protein